jgi:hypothetical protein
MSSNLKVSIRNVNLAYNFNLEKNRFFLSINQDRFFIYQRINLKRK